ncbi:hypothetical protein HYT26_03635 [Candidatus Pacearchaeota archaeon]|nr:hypothetical protein [Candidatus Pacearchaeota archaeon]
MIKKRDCWKNLMFLMILLVFIQGISFASALNIEVEKNAVNSVVVAEANQPAVFNFKIKNLGDTDNFEIYSLVGIDFSPRGTFQIRRTELKELEVKVYPDERVRSKEGVFNFVYNIKGSAGIFEDRISVSIVKMKSLFEISSDNIIVDSDSASVHIANKENTSLDNVNVHLSSVFFDYKINLSFSPFEKKSLVIKLDRGKTKSIIAGTYKLLTEVKIDEAAEKFESEIKYTEITEFKTEAKKEGTIIITESISKVNKGNVPAFAQIKIERDAFSGMFTTFNIAPEKVERRGLSVAYTWLAEVLPAGELGVIAKTNYVYPMLIAIFIIVIVFLLKAYLGTNIELKKDVSFLKTKSGDFALKIRLHARARKFIERITIIDRLPPLVKMYEKYGAIPPEKVDEKNRRLTWNVESLSSGEERIFSYIVYSKIGVVGRFALPLATAIYERNGKIKEAMSNQVFLFIEPHGKKE